ncbi:hypothetical protein LPJ78_005950 [Coemansia sp. RSA 989]|nr:hypothetical protein BX667DRAFT_518083 [Coemansia mojavensis]KAJ1737512.1 hypothetical protein LPJ68_005988 [Coemansia sp. RSA 1086]KAJ1746243.1 hypothetical protein LPJ79_005945 [Coemansia sp. RSA 1821]KAJ1860051.1 hypothetical protein LPJ78_005950 [Coemansia sp. RSA 989]KAJ1867180.1 hypothetical protein LPJ55_005972 [Coemansia sp. RSA 990]KAJ2626586.1 hypothetical protein H4R22_004756 [Coemansia sp. RSA 1290]KAJ2646154.1 hypothetical protein IWW40_005610 [Coemansia sp. RSA 1250]KAJ26669
MTDEVLITVRVIKSFEYRTSRNMVIPVNTATTTVGDLKQQCLKVIGEDAKFKPYRTVEFDTLKIYTQAFKNKTQNLIINLEDSGFLDDNEKLLKDVDVQSETELSFFNRKAYEEYKVNPVMKW